MEKKDFIEYIRCVKKGQQEISSINARFLVDAHAHMKLTKNVITEMEKELGLQPHIRKLIQILLSAIDTNLEQLNDTLHNTKTVDSLLELVLHETTTGTVPSESIIEMLLNQKEEVEGEVH